MREFIDTLEKQLSLLDGKLAKQFLAANSIPVYSKARLRVPSTTVAGAPLTGSTEGKGSEEDLDASEEGNGGTLTTTPGESERKVTETFKVVIHNGNPCVDFDDLLTKDLRTHRNAATFDALKGKLTSEGWSAVLVYGGSGQGKTRVILEYLTQFYGLFLVVDNEHNGGGNLMKTAVDKVKTVENDSLNTEWFASIALLCAVLIRARSVIHCINKGFLPHDCVRLQYTATVGWPTLQQAEEVAYDAIFKSWEGVASRRAQQPQALDTMYCNLRDTLKELYQTSMPNHSEQPKPVWCVDEAQLLLEKDVQFKAHNRAKERTTLYAFLINIAKHFGVTIACSGTGMSLREAGQEMGKVSDPDEKPATSSVVSTVPVTSVFTFTNVFHHIRAVLPDTHKSNRAFMDTLVSCLQHWCQYVRPRYGWRIVQRVQYLASTCTATEENAKTIAKLVLELAQDIILRTVKRVSVAQVNNVHTFLLKYCLFPSARSANGIITIDKEKSPEGKSPEGKSTARPEPVSFYNTVPVVESQARVAIKFGILSLHKFESDHVKKAYLEPLVMTAALNCFNKDSGFMVQLANMIKHCIDSDSEHGRKFEKAVAACLCTQINHTLCNLRSSCIKFKRSAFEKLLNDVKGLMDCDYVALSTTARPWLFSNFRQNEYHLGDFLQDADSTPFFYPCPEAGPDLVMKLRLLKRARDESDTSTNCFLDNMTIKVEHVKQVVVFFQCKYVKTFPPSDQKKAWVTTHPKLCYCTRSDPWTNPLTGWELRRKKVLNVMAERDWDWVASLACILKNGKQLKK